GATFARGGQTTAALSIVEGAGGHTPNLDLRAVIEDSLGNRVCLGDNVVGRIRIDLKVDEDGGPADDDEAEFRHLSRRWRDVVDGKSVMVTRFAELDVRGAHRRGIRALRRTGVVSAAEEFSRSATGHSG